MIDANWQLTGCVQVGVPHTGIRPPGTFDPFETGVRAIVGQQVTVAAANKLMGCLVERLGIPVGGLQRLGLGRLFPGPDVRLCCVC